MKIAERLQKAREKTGLKKAQVAKKIDTTRSNITRWEASVVPTVKWLVKLAELYNMSIDVLVGYEGGGRKEKKG